MAEFGSTTLETRLRVYVFVDGVTACLCRREKVTILPRNPRNEDRSQSIELFPMDELRVMN